MSGGGSFFELLAFYGVPDRIIATLRKHLDLPDVYPTDSPPKSLPNKDKPWLYVYGPTGTGKSTHAAWLLALYLRARARLGPGHALHLTDPGSASYSPGYAPQGSSLSARVFYHYVRVTELLRRMKSDFGSSQTDGAMLFERCLGAQFLILDDLTSEPSAWELAQLDLLIDRRYGDGSFTIITSNHPLDRLAHAIGSERIRGRIGEIAKQKRMRRNYR